MRQRARHLILIACSLMILAKANLVFSDTATDTETLLNWIENNYPNFFPSPQATQEIEPWLYRHYPESGIFAGVNQSDSGVYVLGGEFGNNPTFIAHLSDLINQIENVGGNSNSTACDTTGLPDGVNYSQSGNVVTVTSNGQCLPAPDPGNTNVCLIPQQTTATGISILSSNTITSSRLEGVTISVPGLPETIQSIVDATASIKHCTINATSESINLVANSDLCFDITTLFTDLFANFSFDGITVTPPVNYFFTGTYSSQIVDDCFTTDATTIRDTVSGDTWINQNGSFVKQ